jgi:hypothetical protein
MGILTKAHLPLVSETKFNVSNPTAIASGTAAYGTATTAGAGDWVLGSALPKGRKLLVVVNTSTLANTPTFLKVSLHGSATDANGTSGAEIASTITEIANPAGDSCYTCEIDLAAVTAWITERADQCRPAKTPMAGGTPRSASAAGAFTDACRRAQLRVMPSEPSPS